MRFLLGSKHITVFSNSNHQSSRHQFCKSSGNDAAADVSPQIHLLLMCSRETGFAAPRFLRGVCFVRGSIRNIEAPGRELCSSLGLLLGGLFGRVPPLDNKRILELS